MTFTLLQPCLGGDVFSYAVGEQHGFVSLDTTSTAPKELTQLAWQKQETCSFEQQSLQYHGVHF